MKPPEFFHANELVAVMTTQPLGRALDYKAPEGVTVSAPKQTEIVVEGIDQQVVGQVAAEIREWRKPEPYKGKGIRYKGEFIFRKEGKKK